MRGPTPRATTPPPMVPMATAPAITERLQPKSSTIGLTKTPTVGLTMTVEATEERTVIQTMTHP